MDNMYGDYSMNQINALSFNFATSPRWTDFENWMSQLSANAKKTPLFKLGIPGTHDSGTYNLYTDEIYNVNDFTGIAPTIAGPIIRAMAVTQSSDVYTQLMEGNRYIDLRFARDNKGRIRIVHTVFGEDVSVIFDQIRRFLDSHPKEVVIVDIQNINNLNNADENNMKNVIMEKIGTHLAPRNGFSTSSTVEDYNNANKNCILVYTNASFVESEPLYWFRTPEIIQNPWYNTNDINYLVQQNNEGLNNLPSNRSYFFVSQMVLTINDSQILDIILDLIKWLPVPIYGQIRFTQEFNKLVNTPGIYNITAPNYGIIQDWIVSHSPVDGNNAPNANNIPNIIILDFYQKNNINSIVRYNLAF